MLRLISLAVLLTCSVTVSAQKKKTATVADPKKYAASITPEDLSRHLYIVAGAEMEGRETATEGQKKAAAYIENHFKSLGLLPGNNGSFQQLYPVYKDEIGNASISVNGKTFTVHNDFSPLANWNNTATQYFSEAVFVGHGIVDKELNDYAGQNVTGKLVFMLDGAPSGYKPSAGGFRSPSSWYGKLQTAKSKGAAAVVMVANGFPRKAPTEPTMHVDLYKAELYPNSYFISEQVAIAMLGDAFAQLKEAGKSKSLPAQIIKSNVKLVFEKKTTEVSSSNVLGYIPGSDKSDEWLIITAHYDHLGKRGDVIYYGADDDGSGTVGILEIAEAFAKAKADGKGPRRNILFMTVSGEEKGLWGSEYFSDHPTVPLDKTTADLNIDMIGRVDTERKSADTLNYVYVVGDDKLSSDLKPISEGVNNKYIKMTLDYKFNDPKDPNRIYYRSDHYNFASKGVPIIFYYDGMLQSDYHKPTDTPDKIYYPLLSKRAQLVFYTAWEMANRDASLKRDIPLNQE